jgi:hypothetical protein
MKSVYQCTGVKACEYLDLELRIMHHYQADSELFEAIQARREQLCAEEVVTPSQRQALG